jgi:hypothetical protein
LNIRAIAKYWPIDPASDRFFIFLPALRLSCISQAEQGRGRIAAAASVASAGHELRASS